MQRDCICVYHINNAPKEIQEFVEENAAYKDWVAVIPKHLYGTEAAAFLELITTPTECFDLEDEDYILCVGDYS